VSAESLLLVDPLAKALPGIAPPDKGLGGRLVVRIPRGGCGNALILIVFLSVFPVAFTPGVVRNFGKVRLLTGVVGAVCDVEGARRPLFGKGVDVPDFESENVESVGMVPVLFRVFGSAGNADVGGPYDGLEGRGIAAAIVNNVVKDQGHANEARSMIYFLLDCSTKTLVSGGP
jgi:hypothetical protein